ncbi:hypothetical protein QCE49_28975 [Caballeronia sp. LZ008]|uniref:gp53-like domain-containing protein n=1 Tax=unclassified Caballeronia TaxID=2646786 RepID=UPI0020290BD3|nr:MULTISPECIES: hypothetical protein [unclassified Caballeronia]MDR5797436.1 hypothetical protein [Caballeronia sp. LZ008]
MTNIVDQDQWEAGIYQYETSDPVEGGPDGIDNKPLKQLANRTKYLFNRIAEIFNVAKGYSLAGGTANAITASYTPVVTARVDGMVLRFKAASANNGATTFTPNATDAPVIAPSPIYGLDHAPLTGGEIVVNGLCAVQWNAALNSGNGAWVLIENSAGVRRSITPAQFATGTSVATMDALKRFGVQSSNVQSYSVNTALDLSHVGGTVYGKGTSVITLTLPSATALGLPVGARVDIINATTTTMNVAAANSEPMNAGPTAPSSPLVLQIAEQVTFVWSGAAWFLFGSGVAQYLGQFTRSLASSGYQKLPSGLIIQWGSAVANSSGVATLTLPIAFPNGLGQAVANYIVGGTALTSNVASISSSSSASALVAVATNAANAAAVASANVKFIALGW